MADLLLQKFSPTVGESKWPWSLSEMSWFCDMERAGTHFVPKQIFAGDTESDFLKTHKTGTVSGEKKEMIVSLSTENGLIMAELPKQMPVSELQDGAGS